FRDPIVKVRLDVHVRPGARKEGVRGWQAGVLRLDVTAAPEQGRANRAVTDLLAEALGVRKSAVALVRGRASRNKVIEVDGLSEDEVRRRLGEALDVGE